MKTKLLILLIILLLLPVVFVLTGKQNQPENQAQPTPSPIEKEETLIGIDTKVATEAAEIKKQAVSVKYDEEFTLTLASNPSTGYQWQAEFDDGYLKLLSQDFIPSQENLLGAGGQETFTFNPFKAGETEIIFSYHRPWEEGQIKQILVELTIE